MASSSNGEAIGVIAALTSARTVGQSLTVPRPRALAFVVVAALLAIQVVARYRWGFLTDKSHLWLHIVIGWVNVGIVLAIFHGRAFTRQLTGRVAFILGMTLLGLLVFWYVGRSDSFHRFFGPVDTPKGTFLAIAPFMYFAANATFWRLVIPFMAARFVLQTSPRDLGLPIRAHGLDGLSLKARRTVPWIYLALFLGVLPFVVLVADSPAFLAKYPLSRDMVAADNTISLWNFVGFEAIYFLVFLSGESFWRGFINFGLEKDLGLYGLLFMIVPYVTSHFGKPFAETLGAIAAGLVLGFLALKHRSVWLGVALHYGIALSMDIMAVIHHGYVLK